MEYIYDLETYPNCFLFTGKFLGESQGHVFEISDRMNQRSELLSHLSYLRNTEVEMVGFNNLGFDYPIVHDLLMDPWAFDAKKANELGTKIVTSVEYGRTDIRFKDRLIPQIDLSKINHFDNKMRRTSLKALQVAMRSESVEDLPFEIRALTPEEMDILRDYNMHDVLETEKFRLKCESLIQMRRDILKDGILFGDVMNWSDVKIGTEYLVKKIGREKCYTGSRPKQTFRTQVDFKEIILPKINFTNPDFDEVLKWFKEQTIYVYKKERPKLERPLAGLEFHFGVGGLHASCSSRFFESNSEYVIKDVDVSGMYPAVCVVNKFAPEHLGEAFITAYGQLPVERKQYPKGTVRNLILKLAGNGVSGNFNNEFSCFYDPKVHPSITVNGQLQLLQLIEMFSMLPQTQIIQANTDGTTLYMPRDVVPFFNLWCREWEKMTGLQLEEVEGSKMWIRDVNNYLFIDTKGKIKRKGAYWYPITLDDYHGSSGSNWSKDFSNLASIKAAELAMVRGIPVESAIKLVTDPFDFMLRYKATGDAKVFIGDKRMLKTTRYYVSLAGGEMRKEASPSGPIGEFKRRPGITDSVYHKVKVEIPKGQWDERIHTKNKSVYEIVTTSIESGWKVKECNKVTSFDWLDLDWNYYIQEAKKLVIEK